MTKKYKCKQILGDTPASRAPHIICPRKQEVLQATGIKQNCTQYWLQMNYPPPPGISRLHPEFLQFEALFPLWSNVSKICVLYMKFKRSFPQNVTGFWPAQRVFLFYFLNLSRADLWLDNTAAFSSLCFLSFSNLTLSSTVFLITSWGVNKTREMSQTLQIWQKYCNVTASIFSLYSGLLTLWSSWATCFLRFSTLPAELRPFFLYLGTNFSLASGSKPWGDKKCF